MIKTRRYTIKARPERTVVLIPVRGMSTLLADFNRVVRTESIPRTAAVSILTKHDGSRALRVEWVN